jgi:hypothetical protein
MIEGERVARWRCVGGWRDWKKGLRWKTAAFWVRNWMFYDGLLEAVPY